MELYFSSNYPMIVLRLLGVGGQLPQVSIFTPVVSSALMFIAHKSIFFENIEIPSAEIKGPLLTKTHPLKKHFAPREGKLEYSFWQDMENRTFNFFDRLIGPFESQKIYELYSPFKKLIKNTICPFIKNYIEPGWRDTKDTFSYLKTKMGILITLSTSFLSNTFLNIKSVTKQKIAPFINETVFPIIKSFFEYGLKTSVFVFNFVSGIGKEVFVRGLNLFSEIGKEVSGGILNLVSEIADGIYRFTISLISTLAKGGASGIYRAMIKGRDILKEGVVRILSKLKGIIQTVTESLLKFVEKTLDHFQKKSKDPEEPEEVKPEEGKKNNSGLIGYFFFNILGFLFSSIVWVSILSLGKRYSEIITSWFSLK